MKGYYFKKLTNNNSVDIDSNLMITLLKRGKLIRSRRETRLPSVHL